MKNMNLKILGVSNKFKPYVMIDGKIVQYKRNNFGSYEINYQTEKDEINLKIFKFLELQSKFWILWALLSFIISILGVFEPWYEKKCLVVDCNFNLKLKEQQKIEIKFNNMAVEGRATEIKADCEVEEVENKYYIDKKAKTRWKILLAIKIVIWVVAIALLVFVIAKKF